MTIEYILFEKKAENDKPIWTPELASAFCEEQKFMVDEVKDETLFCVVKIASDDTTPDKHYRLIEITPTISFIVKDEPSLDEFLELEVPDLKALKIKDD